MRRYVPLRLAQFVFLFFVAGLLPCSHAQQMPTLRTRTNLVLVPTLVESKTGEPVFNLTAKDFLLTDNGVEQKIHLDTETYNQPISIVVLVQVGRSAVREFYKYQGLPTMVDALAGNNQHRIAVVEFDSQPRMLQDFTGNSGLVEHAVYSIQPGDDGAAISDAVWYAVDMLQDEPPQNQRVIVLLSETRDHGSRTPLTEVLRKIGQSDVIVYSLAFSAGRADLFDFSGAGDNADLLAPVRMAIAALRKNAAAAIPHMTGGQYLRFNSGKQLDSEMGMLANQVHNRYILSFQPSDPKAGLHMLSVNLRQPLDVRVLARASYWATSPTVMEEDAPSPGPR
ncbi:MAG TPA: VWA domain-containing protein [Acidobacteriaceae bacterium]|nr:VWA domain-containing protein [Terriglobia bacterium]HVC90517.1 VWA domain-containing protein [Acidobacteriaceae bacterium]